jgi:hypothetical protein
MKTPPRTGVGRAVRQREAGGVEGDQRLRGIAHWVLRSGYLRGVRVEIPVRLMHQKVSVSIAFQHHVRYAARNRQSIEQQQRDSQRSQEGGHNLRAAEASHHEEGPGLLLGQLQCGDGVGGEAVVVDLLRDAAVHHAVPAPSSHNQ